MKSSSVSALRNKTDDIKKQTQITFKTPLQDKIVAEFTERDSSYHPDPWRKKIELPW
jgi:hypothetical protein